MKRFYLLLVLLFVTIALARVAGAQKAFPGIDSAEKVISKTRTAITSGQTITVGSPFKIAVTLGDGAKFSKVTPKPFIVMIESSSFTDLTPIEEFRVSAVSHDTLTLIARSPAVGHNLSAQTWAVGSRISIPIAGEYIKSLQDTLNWLITSGPGSGTITSIVFQSPLTGGTITSTGTVTLPMATSSQSGYLSSANWSTFNNKQSTISATSPLLLSGANISVVQSDATHSGYISATDWNTFNNKASYPDSTGNSTKVLTILAGGGYGWSTAGSGTVTSVNVSGGSSGLIFSNGPITSAGAINLSGGSLSLLYGGTGATTAAQARINILPDTAGKTGKYLRVLAGGGIVWDTASGSGSSGVTSVAATVPAFLSIAGSPITTTGTLAFTLSGTALPYSSGGTGQNAWTKGDVLYASNTNTLSKLAIGTTGQILTVASGLPSWAANAAGTVTSVAASGPSGIMTWSSAVTSSGTLTATLASQSANMVLAAPDGSSGTPSFRSLVVGDIPALDVAEITSGSFSVARGGTGRSTLTANDLILGNGTSAVTLLAPGGTNTVLTGSSTPSFQTLAVDATLVGNGIGTSFGIDLTHASTWTGTPTVSKANILTTYTDGLTLTNPTAADVSNTVQQSPSISLTSQVWNTTATAMDSVETWRITNVPTSGASTTSSLMLDNGNTGAGFTNVASLSDAGVWNLKTGGSLAINGTLVLSATTLGSGVVNSSLTSVGTIATGVWSGTTVAVNKGGTGATTLTGILFGNGTSAITGSHSVSLTSEVTGTLPVSNGGTSLATLTAHSLYVGNGTSAPTALGAATNGQIAIGSTGADPVLAALTGAAAQVTVTNSAGGIAFSLPNTITFTNGATTIGVAISSSANGANMTLNAGDANGTDKAGGRLDLDAGGSTGNLGSTLRLGVAESGQGTGTSARAATPIAQLTSTTTLATFQVGEANGAGGQLRFVNGSGGARTYTITTGTQNVTSYTATLPDATGTIALTSNVIAETTGGTNQTSYTTGDMLYASASNTLSKRAIGTTGQVLMVTAGVPTWTDVFKNTGGAAKCGQAALVSGTATVTTTSAITTSLIYITDVTGSGVVANIGKLRVDSISNGVSFTVVSDNVLDASSFNWLIINP